MAKTAVYLYEEPRQAARDSSGRDGFDARFIGAFKQAVDIAQGKRPKTDAIAWVDKLTKEAEDIQRGD